MPAVDIAALRQRLGLAADAPIEVIAAALGGSLPEAPGHEAFMARAFPQVAARAGYLDRRRRPSHPDRAPMPNAIVANAAMGGGRLTAGIAGAPAGTASPTDLSLLGSWLTARQRRQMTDGAFTDARA